MSNIKAQYKAIYAILENNSNKKVSTIMPELLALMESKQNSKNFILDSEGNVQSIFCYYHKRWEDVSEHEYGKKSNTATGLNTMCKAGVSHWTKQQRAKKQAESELLAQLSDGTLDIKDLPEAQEAIAQEASKIITD